MVFKYIPKSAFFIAAIINLIAVVISIIFGTGKFSSLDDFFMTTVLNGAYGGEYDVHTYFVNAAYGYFLKPFYTLFPTVGWYGVFLTFGYFAAFTVITFFILKKMGIKWGTIISILFLFCVSSYFYVHFAFTQSAAVLTAAGMLLFVEGISERKKYFICLAVFFALFGSIWRWHMFLMSVPAFAFMFAFNYLHNQRKIWLFSIIAFALCVTAAIGLKNFNSNIFQTDGYKYYAAYQPVRATFGDGTYFDNEALSDELDERGMLSHDYRYLIQWYFYDKDVFSIDSLAKKLSIVHRNRFEPNYVKMPIAILREIAKNFVKPILWCWLSLCLLLILFSNGKSRFSPWLSLGVIGICYSYLLLVNRVVDHVEIGIWLYAIVLLISSIDIKELHFGKYEKALKIILIVISSIGILWGCIGLFFDGNPGGSQEDLENEPNWNEFLAYSQNHPDDVFLLPYGRYKSLGKFIGYQYKAVVPNSLQNIFPTGYWNINLPSMENELRKRGVCNLFRDIKNDNLYVVDDFFKYDLLQFYLDHYHEQLKIDTLRSFGNMYLLKYRSTEDAK